MSSDPDFQSLVELSAIIEGDYQEDGVDWTGSPFAWMQSRPSGQKGVIFKKLVAGWCAGKGLNAYRLPGKEATLLVEGLRIQIKGSFLWKAGTYRFQQFRDQNYDLVICLGLSPFAAHCWAIPKSEIMSAWEDGEIRTQHMGDLGVDTAWFAADPYDPPEWLAPWGGSLPQAYQIIVQEA